MASISATAALVTNSLCYTDGKDLVCNGTGPALAASSPTITTGVSGSIVYRDQSGLLIASSSLSISSTTGSVGIGAGAPASLGNYGLYAAGKIRADSDIISTLGNVFLSSGYGLLWSNTNAWITGDGTNKYLSFLTSNTEAMRIVSNGFVGISTSTPAYKLDVNGTVNGAYLRSNAQVWAGSGTAPAPAFSFIGDTTTGLYSPSQYSFGIAVSGTEAMRIVPSGNVGIGTPAPSTTLSISGTLKIANGGEACDANRLGAMRYSSSAFQVCQNATNGWEPLATGGVSSTQDRIISGTTQAIAYNNTSLSLVTAGTERVVIGTSGIVGIGQQPATGQSLSVSGTTGITGRLSLLTPTGSNVLVGSNAGLTNTGSNVTALGYNAASANTGANATAVGYGAGQTNTAAGLTAMGYQAGYNNSAPQLTALGYQAGKSNSAASSTIIGYNAGQYNAGSNTTAVGANAGQLNSADGFTGIGYSAGFANNGLSSTAVGSYAGQSNNGNNLTALGMSAGQNNNSANLTAIGYQTAQNSSGTNVTAIGASAAGSNVANNVTAMGVNAAQYNSSSALTAVGYNAGQNNSGTNVTAIGQAAAQNNVGGNITALGFGAGSSNAATNSVLIGNTAGAANNGAYTTAVGSGVALANSGSGASLFGYSSGNANSGVSVTAIGAYTALTNTANNLTVVGAYAGQYSNAANTTAVGYSAGQNNTGTDLTAIGSNAAVYNTASQNVAIGSSAARYATTGSNNTSVGYLAGQGVSNSTNYARNTLVGAFAGTALTAGSSNTIIGFNAGAAITTGTNNLVLGAQTTPYSNTGSYQLNIANAVWGDIGSGSAATNKIGINVTSPTTSLEVSGTISATNITINGQALTPGAASVIAGASGSLIYRDQTGNLTASAGLTISSTTGSIGVGGTPQANNNGIYAAGFIQAGAGMFAPYVYALSGPILTTSNSVPVIRVAAGVTDPSLTFAGGSNMPEAMRIVSSGLVGIGTTTPSTTLYVSGTGSITGNLTVGVTGNTAARVLFLRGSDGASTASAGLASSNGQEFRFNNSTGNSYYTWYTNNSSATAERMRLTQTGALGISNTAPSTTLDVGGSIRIADGGEACDTNRAGAIRYTSASIFQSCNGTAWAALGGSNATGDAIISGTTNVTVNSATSVISLTTTGTTWGYLTNGTSYLPQLNSTGISATTVTASLIVFNGISATAGVSSSSGGSGDNLGNHTATATLDMASNTIINAAKIGVGTATPGTYSLYVTGDAYSTGAWSTSDARFKTNIHAMTGLLDKVDLLRPVTFTWKPNSMPARTISGTQIGLIAQEVEKIYPELVKTNSDGYKAVAYDKLGVLLLGAVKDLKSQNDDLRTQLGQMRHDIETLKHQQPAR